MHNNALRGICRALIASMALILCGAAAAQSSSQQAAFTAVGIGPITNFSLAVKLQVKGADAGKSWKYYLYAKLNETWYAHNGSGWFATTPGSMPHYWEGTLPYGKTQVNLPAADRTGAIGAQVYAGYGASEADMRDKQQFRMVYVITPDSNMRELLVWDTDPAILFKAKEAKHIYRDCAPSCTEEKLFVFLPGSGGAPEDHQRIAYTIGKTGIPVLVLAYENDPSVQDNCGLGDACLDQARRERVEGAAGGNHVHSVADGIKNRLLKALQKLNPPGGTGSTWGRFYSGETLLFDRIIFGGFSQGAGMAAWIGKHYKSPRICQFSGTWDRGANGPAAWLSQPPPPDATPGSDYYGFSHQADMAQAGGGIAVLSENWTALGMGAGAPELSLATNSRKIYSNSADPTCLQYAHACSAMDFATPINADGSAVFAPAWRYACGR